MLLVTGISTLRQASVRSTLVQTEGPLIIDGYSHGGSAALCMAAKLAKRDGEVAHCRTPYTFRHRSARD